MVVDTSFFKGNFPEQCSLEACAVDGVEDAEALAAGDGVEWEEILPRSALQGDAENLFAVAPRGRVTHLRFNIYPDGGVARLRVYGEPVPDAQSPAGRARPTWPRSRTAASSSAAATCSSATGTTSSCPAAPPTWATGGRPSAAADPATTGSSCGWRPAERSRRIEVDTDHFKGNAPESCSVETCDVPGLAPELLSGPDLAWATLLPRTALQPDAQHQFEVTGQPATHARLAIYPDGGIARLRLFGTVSP